MTTPWLFQRRIDPGYWQRGYRSLLIVISLVCLWVGLLILSFPDKVIAQIQTSAVQKADIEQLTKQCSQQFQKADYQQMLETCTQAVEKSRAIGNRRSEAYALINLGSAYGSLGQYSQAVDASQQTLQLVRELEDQSGEAYALINLGNAYKSLGQHPQAIGAAQQALQLAYELGDQQIEAYGLINLASAHWAMGDYDQVLDYSKKSLQLAQITGDQRGEACSLINLGSAHESLKQYPQAMDYFQQALQLAQTTHDYRSEALALNNLGYVLYKNEQFTEAETYLRQSIDVLEALRPALSDADKLSLFETLTNPYYNLQEVLVAQGKTAEALAIAERGRARAFVELLARRLTTNRSPSRSERQVSTPITLTEIKQVAHEQNATLVEYAMAASNRLYIWVVSSTGNINFREVDLSPLETSLSNLIKTTNASIVEGSSSVSDGPQQLYQILIAPIRDLLPANPESHVIFIPHKSLFLTPFSALQAADGSYLIEHHTLRTAPSIQVLQLTHQRQQQQQQTIEKALIVGNPTNDLPAAEREAKTIARFFNTTPLLGKQATKAAVIRQMSRANLIHVATHAAPNRLNENYGGLIVLADPITGFSNLTTDEILDMDLQAELVVLSGCSTGVSDIINSDGVVGLARSIMTAGVPSVVMSLWQVPDAPTAALMQEFYRHWRLTPHSSARMLLRRLLWLAVFGMLLLISAWLRRSKFCKHTDQRRLFHWGLVAVVVSIILAHVNLGAASSPLPHLDKAQALRQAMLTKMQTHPQPKDWAAFILMGEAE